jgi:hypothetical protein
MTNASPARPARPQRQASWTRLGAVVGYTDTEPKRARIRAAVETMLWVQSNQLADVLRAAPLRFLVAGHFHDGAPALRRVAVTDPPRGALWRDGRLVGLESDAGDRFVLLACGHEAIDLLHETAPIDEDPAIGSTDGTSEERRRAEDAARHLYDAEVALHIAHQTHVDAWITAAADRLHDALVEHLRAVEAAQPGGTR